MSYENNQCVCGGKKPTETMLCDECEAAVAGSFDRKRMDDKTASYEDRRRSAIFVLSVCRKRKHQQQAALLPLAFRL